MSVSTVFILLTFEMKIGGGLILLNTLSVFSGANVLGAINADTRANVPRFDFNLYMVGSGVGYSIMAVRSSSALGLLENLSLPTV